MVCIYQMLVFGCSNPRMLAAHCGLSYQLMFYIPRNIFNAITNIWLHWHMVVHVLLISYVFWTSLNGMQCWSTCIMVRRGWSALKNELSSYMITVFGSMTGFEESTSQAITFHKHTYKFMHGIHIPQVFRQHKPHTTTIHNIMRLIF